MPDGSIFTGTKVRTKQTPLYDSFAIAAAVNLATTIKMFGNIVGVNSVGPEITNMEKSFELQGGNQFLVRAMRISIIAAAVDIASFIKGYTCRLFAGGIKLLEAPADYWPGGVGVPTASSNGVQDPRAVYYMDLDPINLTDGVNFRVDMVGTPFAPTAAFFLRTYLEGRWTEPV